MKSPITIDFENSTITVNAAYAKKASNPFSAEYAQIVIQQYIENYCLRNGIGKTERIFNLTERAISN